MIARSIPYLLHDDVIKWKHFPRYWQFVRGIPRSPVNSPHKGQWRGALMFSLISVWINGWVNNREAGELRRYHAHYDVIVIVNIYLFPKQLITYIVYCHTSLYNISLRLLKVNQTRSSTNALCYVILALHEIHYIRRLLIECVHISIYVCMLHWHSKFRIILSRQ